MVVHLISAIALGRDSTRHISDGGIGSHDFTVHLRLMTSQHSCSFPDPILKAALKDDNEASEFQTFKALKQSRKPY